MRGRYVAVVLAFLAVGGSARAAEPAACIAPVVVPDAEGDVTYTPTVERPAGVPLVADASVLDFTSMQLSRAGDLLFLSATLVARPPTNVTTESYRYWIGFELSADGGPPELVDVRVAQTLTYDSGSFIGSNERGNPRYAELPAIWNDTTVTFAVPLDHLYSEYATTNLSFSAPSGMSDGPHRSHKIPPQSVGAPWMQDFVPSPNEWQPLPACPGIETESAAAPSQMSQQATPGFPSVGVFASVTILALALRRRRP